MENMIIRKKEEVDKLKKKLKIGKSQNENGDEEFNIRYNRITYNVGDVVDIELSFGTRGQGYCRDDNEICNLICKCKITEICVPYEGEGYIEVARDYITDCIYVNRFNNSTDYIIKENIDLSKIVSIHKNNDSLMGEILDLYEDQYNKKFVPVDMSIHYSYQSFICNDDYYDMGRRVKITFLYTTKGGKVLYGSETGIITGIRLRDGLDIAIELYPESSPRQRKKFDRCILKPGAILIRSEIISQIEELECLEEED